MKQFFIYLVSTLLCISILSCGSNNDEYTNGYENEHYLLLSTFNIQEDALKAGDNVKLLYLSGLGDPNITKNYLLHLVALKLDSNDTVNILTFEAKHIEEGDRETIFLYEPMSEAERSSINTKEHFSNNLVDNLKESQTINNGEEFLKNMKDSFIMVDYDKRFEDIAKNKHPTVFGNVFK